MQPPSGDPLSSVLTGKSEVPETTLRGRVSPVPRILIPRTLAPEGLCPGGCFRE